jgi:hypothetical protein
MNQTTHTRWLQALLSAIVCLLAVIAIELSALLGPMQPRALAQIPDSGKQRYELLDAQKKTSANLERILQHLRTQTIKVKVVSTDKDSKRPATVKPLPERN